MMSLFNSPSLFVSIADNNAFLPTTTHFITFALQKTVKLIQLRKVMLKAG